MAEEPRLKPVQRQKLSKLDLKKQTNKPKTSDYAFLQFHSHCNKGKRHLHWSQTKIQKLTAVFTLVRKTEILQMSGCVSSVFTLLSSKLTPHTASETHEVIQQLLKTQVF